MVIDRKYGIAGAQSIDTFKSALTQAWNDQHASGVSER